MTREEFDEVTKRVLELWPRPTFARHWNHANQTVAFKKLSTFAQHEVLDALENHRYDNPDAREPKFNEVAAKLWNVKRARAEQAGTGGAALPSWPTILAWADRKSDDDLAHLWRIATDAYSTAEKPDNKTYDKLWPFLNSLPSRSHAKLTVMWAVEHNVELTFKRGSDEWHAVMDEYDRRERERSVEEYRTKRASVKLATYPAEPPSFASCP